MHAGSIGVSHPHAAIWRTGSAHGDRLGRERRTPRTKRPCELLAMVRPDNPWSDLTDAEVDELTSRMHRQ